MILPLPLYSLMRSYIMTAAKKTASIAIRTISMRMARNGSTITAEPAYKTASVISRSLPSMS